MYKVLIYEINKDFLELVEKSLQMEISVQIKAIHQLDEISAALNQDSFDLIVMCFTTSEYRKDSLQKIVDKIGEAQVSPQVLLYAPKEPKLTIDCHYYGLESYKVGVVIEAILSILDPKKEKRKAEIPNFIPYPMHYFFNLTQFESDIYIKLKKRTGDQFVKRINANEEFDKMSLIKYQQSGLNELYIPKEFRFRFVDLAVEKTIKKIAESSKAPNLEEGVKEVISLGDNTYQMTADLIESLGISEQTVKLTEVAVGHIKKSLKNSKQMSNLLQNLLKNQLSYNYKRCHLITMFSLEVLKRIDWFGKGQLKETFEKLAFASFLHDITLTDDKLLRIHSKADLYKANLSPEDKEIVLNHANRIATIVQSYPNAPTNVDIIIKQHHGTTNGIGFADNLNIGLAKGSIILIVVEKFVIRILDFKKSNETLKEIFAQLYLEFSLPTYRKVVDALNQTVLKIARNQ